MIHLQWTAIVQNFVRIHESFELNKNGGQMNLINWNTTVTQLWHDCDADVTSGQIPLNLNTFPRSQNTML